MKNLNLINPCIMVSVAKIENNENKNKKNLQVVGSIIKYSGEINIESIEKTSSFLSQYTRFFEKNKFIIIHLNFWDNYYKDTCCLLDIENVKYLSGNIFKFIDEIKQGGKNLDQLVRLFNDNMPYGGYSVAKALDRLFLNENFLLKDSMGYNNLIFIFDGMPLSVITFFLRIIGVTIYGGSSNRRHLLSTVHKSLVMFLELLNEMCVDPDIIYESYKDVEVSNAAKYDNNFIKLLDRVYKPSNEIDKQEAISELNKIVELGSESYTLYTKLNLLFISYLKIFENIGLIRSIRKELSTLDPENKHQVGRIESLKASISKLEEGIQVVGHSLYKFDKNLFNENGEFVYDSDIKLDVNKVFSPTV
jgi:hypothetical protein